MATFESALSAVVCLPARRQGSEGPAGCPTYQHRSRDRNHPRGRHANYGTGVKMGGVTKLDALLGRMNRAIAGVCWSDILVLRRDSAPLSRAVCCLAPVLAMLLLPEPGAAQQAVYTVQLGAFRERGAAEVLVERLQEKGFEPRLVHVGTDQCCSCAWADSVSGQQQSGWLVEPERRVSPTAPSLTMLCVSGRSEQVTGTHLQIQSYWELQLRSRRTPHCHAYPGEARKSPTAILRDGDKQCVR